MAQSTQHGLWAVVVDSTVLGGITALNVRSGSQVRGEPRSNEVYNRFLSLVEQKPVLTFTTEAIAAALDLCGVVGLDIDGLTNGLIYYAQQHDDGGTRKSGANHRKYVLRDGILIPQRLTVDHRGDASLDYMAAVTYDGVNDPITWSENQSLPAGIADSQRFTIGAVELEAKTLTHITHLELDFGITATPESADSDIWDTIVSIEKIAPTLRLRGKDPTWLKSTTIPLTGLAITHANTNIYLRKRSVGGTFVADATAEHIKLTMEGMATIDQVFDARGNATGETDVVVNGRYDGANTPIVVDTTSALP